jgi:endonuclease-3 related protein
MKQMRRNAAKTLMAMHRTMSKHFGPLNWWPGETQFEMIVGAMLTQNTAWKNVERAIANLKGARALSPDALHKMPIARLAQLIRPSGYFNIKAKRLRAFLDFLFGEHDGSLKKMFGEKPGALRERLLAVNGVGPETADSILLYAGRIPTFVVDAYTKRIFSRHGLLTGKEKYHGVKEFFEKNLPRETQLYNEYHAQIVNIGKLFCRRIPRCAICPLNKYLPKKANAPRARFGTV